jgi:maltose/moltooligosaccharide transporter
MKKSAATRAAPARAAARAAARATSAGTTSAGATRARPQLTFWQIWNMCFGFLGLQFGFALQNANVSRIFQTLGAEVDQLSVLWIAAPLTGLLVQPIIGYCSDRTWTRLGRRRPYFLAGAILASGALLLMPRSPTLWFAAGMLWILDASINISMEPFRAFVGDMLGPKQRPQGYSMQSFFIGVGAVVAGAMPWLLDKLGVSNHSQSATGAAIVPDTVRYSFELGALVLFAAVLWTIFRTREYSPDVLHSFPDAQHPPTPASGMGAEVRPTNRAAGLLWSAVGVAIFVVIAHYALDKQLYLIGAGFLVWGLLQLFFSGSANALGSVLHDMQNMPDTMRRLVPVQFFSWLALFSMWLYTTAAVTQVHFGSTDPKSDLYNQGANWVGVLFSFYNGFAAVAAFIIPVMVRQLGMRLTHLVNLWIGGLAFLSFFVIGNPTWLILSMLGVGFAWASILSLPYALLSDSVPAHKMGLYMGIFNFFIVIPQLVAASVLGVILKWLFHGAPIYALMIGGVSFFIAGLFALRVPQPTDPHD